MDEMKGMHIITVLRRKWILVTIITDIFLSAGIAFLLTVLTNKLFSWALPLGILYACIIFIVLFFIQRPWLVKETGVAQLLNETYPQLEESAGLLLLAPPSLNMLERLQYNKTDQVLSAIPQPLNISKKIITPAFVFAILLIAGIGLYKIPFHVEKPAHTKDDAVISHPQKAEIILPQIAGINIAISPPAYTARPARHQQVFNLIAEEGSVVNWQLQTSKAATEIKFIFNDTLKIALHSANAQQTQWRLDKKIESTGFYQVSIDGKVSELYKIETIKDKPPVVLIQSPKQYTTIDFGEAPQFKLGTTINDDYGIKDAYISATIASGSGEAVKFKEQKISLADFAAGKMQYQLQQTISLSKLGMQPGDELYFYIQATDNHQQQTRSDIYIVNLPDTAQLMSLEGLANSLSIKPEYFRSQRQIIIETEQLLKDKDTLSEETFKNRCNNLGIDQKLLRLRYGKFLGDEDESGQNNDNQDLQDLSNFSNEEKVRDAYTDKHDNAEDATFYEPETKKQLRATLTEMWDAEIRLRVFTPAAALPFEYRALRLLKDLQQKSRAYVAKTNFKTTPLDLKKRLTGDVSKINQPVLQKDIKQEADLQLPVRNALSLLEEIKAGNTHVPPLQILEAANLRLHEKAVQQPSVYLTAIEAMKKIMAAINTAKAPSMQDVRVAEQGLQQLLSVPDRLPSADKSSSKQALSKQYFNNLQKKQP